MAHAILEKIVRERNLDIEVTSAGINDFTGTPPADNAWLTCLHNDAPVSKMESSFVPNLDLDKIDYFLAMEREHKRFLSLIPQVQQTKILLLGAYDNLLDEHEIADPINKPKRAFQECYDRIERCIESFLIHTAKSNRLGTETETAPPTSND